MNESEFPALIVGLTGQSGSGKTTVCQVFRDNGFEVINADTIAREVMTPGEKCLSEVSEFFSKDNVISEDGTLNRSRLAEIVFTDEAKLGLLNSITYPHITERILNNIKKLAESGSKFILLGAPTLFESHADDFCDLVISVLSRRESRIQRIMQRDSISREKAENRLNSQLTDEFFMNNSDYIIKNNKSISVLKDKALEVSNKVKEYYYAQKAN